MSAAAQKPTIADVQVIESRLLELREQADDGLAPAERAELLRELGKIARALKRMLKRVESNEGPDA